MLQSQRDEILQPTLSRAETKRILRDVVWRARNNQPGLLLDGWGISERDGIVNVFGRVPYPVEEMILEDGKQVAISLPAGMPGVFEIEYEEMAAWLYLSNLVDIHRTHPLYSRLVPIANPEDWEETLSHPTPVFEFQSNAVSAYDPYRLLVLGQKTASDAVDIAADWIAEHAPGLLASEDEEEDRFAIDFGNYRIPEASIAIVSHPAGGGVWRNTIILTRLASDPGTWSFFDSPNGALVFSTAD